MEQFFCLFINLKCDRVSPVSGEVSRSSLTAEDTSPGSKSTVTIGTGHTAVQSEFVYFFAELLPREFVKRIISAFHKFILA